jgi:hypothetical protein
MPGIGLPNSYATSHGTTQPSAIITRRSGRETTDSPHSPDANSRHPRYRPSDKLPRGNGHTRPPPTHTPCKAGTMGMAFVWPAAQRTQNSQPELPSTPKVPVAAPPTSTHPSPPILDTPEYPNPRTANPRQRLHATRDHSQVTPSGSAATAAASDYTLRQTRRLGKDCDERSGRTLVLSTLKRIPFAFPVGRRDTPSLPAYRLQVVCRVSTRGLSSIAQVIVSRASLGCNSCRCGWCRHRLGPAGPGRAAGTELGLLVGQRSGERAGGRVLGFPASTLRCMEEGS